MSHRAIHFCIVCALMVYPVTAATAQDSTLPAPGAELEQLLTDTEALVIGTQTTLRCAFYASDPAYLTPLESVAARIRLEQYEAAIAPNIDDIAGRMSGFRAQANAIACDDPGLAPYLGFSRQVARDVIDIGLVALRDIDIARCNYFADDAFMASVDRAKEVAEDLEPEGDSARVTYIEDTAAGWVSMFSRNCTNLQFDPTETLPGQIALAIPRPG